MSCSVREHWFLYCISFRRGLLSPVLLLCDEMHLVLFFFAHLQNLAYFPEIHIWIHTRVSLALNSVFHKNFYRNKLILKKYFWWISVYLPAQHCGIAVSLPGKHSSVQYPLTWCFFFHTLIFFLACFTFIFILLALSLSFAPSSRIVTKLFSFGIYMSASNTTRRLGNQASLGISIGLFFLYLLMKVAMGHFQSSWWNSLRLLALDDNSVWGRKLLYMYFKQRLWDLRLLACQITLKFRFIFLNLWLST